MYIIINKHTYLLHNPRISDNIMRCKIVHGIDDNENIHEFLVNNNNLPNDDPDKLTEDDFCARWLALKPQCQEHESPPFLIGKTCPQHCCKSWERYIPCLNCLYYGEFSTISDAVLNEMDAWEPPIVECTKKCLNCITYGEQDSEDSGPDSIS